MTRSSIERAVLLALLSCVALFATPVFAQPVTDPKEMARALGEEGLALHAEGRFAEAFEKFATAERIQHSPVLVLWMARSKRALGALVEAKKIYQRVANETLASDASEKWQNAKSAAVNELGMLRVPTLEVRMRGSNIALTIDERAAVPGKPVELDPGEHRVRAETKGRRPLEQRIRLEEGDREVVTLSFDEPVVEKGSVIPGAVILSVGLAAVLAGAITGGYALALADDVEERCSDTHCLVEDEATAADADRLARASTGLLIAGGVLAAGGVVLLIVRPGGGQEMSVSLGQLRLRF